MTDFKGSWDDHLPLIKFAYNYSYHLSIRMSLSVALYGMGLDPLADSLR